MNKKKVGELDGTPIVTGKKNYTNEHEYYLTMNEDNTYQKLEQRVSGDKFRLVLGGGGSSTNPGYNVTKQTVTLFNDTIETQESGEIYQGVVENIDFDIVAGENYTVVFDGTSYDVKAITSPVGDGVVILGEFDDGPAFETYPFFIMYSIVEGLKGFTLLTNIEGSHTVEIKYEEKTVTTTPEFKDAVDSVTGYSIDTSSETLYDGTVERQGIITPTVTLVLGDTYKVTFNGTEYTCKCSADNGDINIGAPYDYEENTYDWSTYPFNIITYDTGVDYATELSANQEGPFTLKIEHLSVSTKTTSAFESMIQGIACSGSSSGCQMVYPDSISWMDWVYSLYNTAPEAGKIYFIPFIDNDSPYRGRLYPVHIDELTNNNNQFGGFATIIGNPIIVDNGTLTVQPFDNMINPQGNYGLCIEYNGNNNSYNLFYGSGPEG